MLNSLVRLYYCYYYYCKVALRRAHCTSFCRNPVLKLLHARTHISRDHESHPIDHSLHIEYVQSVSLALGKHTRLSVICLILQGKDINLFPVHKEDWEELIHQFGHQDESILVWSGLKLHFSLAFPRHEQDDQSPTRGMESLTQKHSFSFQNCKTDLLNCFPGNTPWILKHFSKAKSWVEGLWYWGRAPAALGTVTQSFSSQPSNNQFFQHPP